MNHQPPHEIRDREKLEKMIEHLRNGNELPPIVANGEIAFSGSHRLAAYSVCNMDPQVVEINDEEFVTAMGFLGLDQYDEYEYNDLCYALYKTTDRHDVRDALIDQF